MVRSLWTAASGMRAQQTNVDTISNNLANVNTTGFKKETTEFKSLFYQTLADKSFDSEGMAKPVPAQVGLGVRNSAIVSRFNQGTLIQTENPYDFAIQGEGFFQVRTLDGTIGYTRNGAFTPALGVGGYTISTSEGYPLLDVNNNPIVLSDEYDMSKITINTEGQVCYPDGQNNAMPIGIQIGLVQFANPSGLEKTSGSIFLASEASGEPQLEVNSPNLKQSVVKQMYLEQSNVSAVDEMVNLIVAQRAYEMNSKIITASDDMLRTANNLRQ